MKRLLVLIMAMFFLSACTSEVDQFIAECEEGFPAYAEEMDDIIARWDDALDVALSTSRMSLDGPIGELQGIKREADRLDAPECIADSHASFVDGLDVYIGFMLDFLADADATPDEDEINRANLQMLTVLAAIESYEEDPEAFFASLKEAAEEATREAE